MTKEQVVDLLPELSKWTQNMRVSFYSGAQIAAMTHAEIERKIRAFFSNGGFSEKYIQKVIDYLKVMQDYP